MAETVIIDMNDEFREDVLATITSSIDLAADDVGLEKENYGMLEQRIYWYANVDKFTRGYEIELKLDHDEFLVLVTDIIPVNFANPDRK